MKKMKLVGLTAVALYCVIGGLVCAAAFAVETLGSWPKALWEARMIFYGQVGLFLGLLLAPGKLRRRIQSGAMGMVLVALIGSVWAAGIGSRFGICFWTLILFILLGGLTLAQLEREIFQKRIPAQGDPSLN